MSIDVPLYTTSRNQRASENKCEKLFYRENKAQN